MSKILQKFDKCCKSSKSSAKVQQNFCKKFVKNSAKILQNFCKSLIFDRVTLNSTPHNSFLSFCYPFSLVFLHIFIHDYASPGLNLFNLVLLVTLVKPRDLTVIIFYVKSQKLTRMLNLTSVLLFHSSNQN